MAMNEPIPHDPTHNEALALFKSPEFAPLLYQELIKRPEHQSSDQRQARMPRVRETLLKLIVIIGVCKPLEAIFKTDAITRPGDKDYSFSSILNDVETEVTVLSGIMVHNLPRETGWYLRGTRRVGVSIEDTETLQQCIELAASFCRLRLHRVPRVADIEQEV
ncbi:hypothetical protein BU25DRAFT_430955 [Macroventuria anomochaeta]|uniref:Uncharacterized protein n=1 Tax=Macroventuria anomochaeta TaxID=301207 RepID=A0ACB6S445_9PLEO|nr:uncharacterized protein BU25DRAFT_430955 [Macroventuria anomochaeta]KAF2628133.1 hypothetical protein BU25DRAFT_430955 [Macroventuria anomochaeta]